MKLDEMRDVAVSKLNTRVGRQLPLDEHNTVVRGATPHFIYLQDPVTGEVERRYLGSDGHLGATELC